MNPHLPVNRVFISMTALRHNFREVRELADGRLLMAVVKADGYGHGLVESALTLAQAGADALGVVTVEDGLVLRETVRLPVYVLGGTVGSDQFEPIIRQGLRIFAGCVEEVRALADKARELGLTAHIHLKIDTGLNRWGLTTAQAPDFLREALTWPHLEILGLATQLATAGDQGAHEQLAAFDRLCFLANGLGLRGDLNSALSSEGLIWHRQHQARLLRVGLLLYGVHPGPELGPVRPDLRPAMTVLSRVTGLRDISAGETVGPNRAFKADRPMKLAVVPFGYGQGLQRSRSGRGWVLIRGRRAPEVGLITMNASTYDVTHIPDVVLGDNAVILGRHGPDSVKATDLAAWAATTPHEVLNLLGRLNSRFIEGSDYEENAGG